MAGAFSQEVKDQTGKAAFLYAAKLTASGSYATGGEVLGLRGKMPTLSNPTAVIVVGKAGFIYEYDHATDKLLVRVNDAGGANAPNAEHTVAGYVAGVTGDDIRLLAIFPRV